MTTKNHSSKNGHRLIESCIATLLLALLLPAGVKAQTINIKGMVEPSDGSTAWDVTTRTSIDTLHFALRAYIDGVEDTNGAVKMYYTTNGNTPTTASNPAVNGQEILTVDQLDMKVLYSYTPDNGSEISNVVTISPNLTYSTSENYQSYYHNSVPYGGNGSITIFVRSNGNTIGTHNPPYIYSWHDYDSNNDSWVEDDGAWREGSNGSQLTSQTADGNWYYRTYETSALNFKISNNIYSDTNANDLETGDFLNVTQDLYCYYFDAGLINAADAAYETTDKVAFFSPQIWNRGNIPASGAEDTSYKDASDDWTQVYCYAYISNNADYDIYLES